MRESTPASLGRKRFNKESPVLIKAFDRLERLLETVTHHIWSSRNTSLNNTEELAWHRSCCLCHGQDAPVGPFCPHRSPCQLKEYCYNCSKKANAPMDMPARRCNRYTLWPVFQTVSACMKKPRSQANLSCRCHGYDILSLPILLVGKKAHCKQVGMEPNEPQLLWHHFL